MNNSYQWTLNPRTLHNSYGYYYGKVDNILHANVMFNTRCYRGLKLFTDVMISFSLLLSYSLFLL